MKKNGFSLMEMMIVLLIMSIIAAATAPIVSKKMSKGASSSNTSPWVFIDTKGNAAFNMAGKNVTAVIGASKVPDNVKTRLYIDCGSSSDSQLTFGSGGEVMQVTADPAGRVGISNDNVPNNSVALGNGQTLGTSNIVAIGSNAKTSQTYSVAVGSNAQAGNGSTALNAAEAVGKTSIALGYGAKASGDNSSAIGQAEASQREAISIGNNAKASGTSSVAIGGYTYSGSGRYTVSSSTSSVAVGAGAQATDPCAIAIGNYVTASGNSSIAIGAISSSFETKATGTGAIALGYNAQATKANSMALGDSTRANHEYSTAIGFGAQTGASHQIRLGTEQDVVYIPGHLVVGGNTFLGSRGNYVTWLKHKTYGKNNWHIMSIEVNSGKNDDYRWGASVSDATGQFAIPGFISDRRLKNVGDKYTTGLDALKKLDFYHFTFKKDETKTPHVGVIAQDLQKVFPDAVTKGEDGFLRIRMEDMFYAVINAIKELDAHICAAVSKNNEQEKEIQELKKRIEKLESKNNS